ncbi:hypothetical protein MSAN_01732500 [Mycena sanguinolenta]|uniref:Aminoglycoside phosphotransferase domain-containing protein n=1 Tax=Mycena sanguinolenta TaxID=230812 RepID=A0A8H6XZI5_9AGAR|nr:hypothetical protein MSAN_01732500 [Mycena sanguinolenta]
MEPPSANGTPSVPTALEWDWEIEHEDREREAQADAALHGAMPFEVDRRILRDVVMEHMKTPVARIVFLSAGTFHKAYLITLTSAHQVVARVARRFMPRLKTESEIATLRYLREKTRVPVPEIHWYDSNPYNRLGGEWILMSKVGAEVSCCKIYGADVGGFDVAGTRGGFASSAVCFNGAHAAQPHLSSCFSDGDELEVQRSELSSPGVHRVFSLLTTETDEITDTLQAPGIPLSKVYHSLSYAQLVKLVDSLAKLVIPLFGHRFQKIGSLYLGPDPTAPRAPSPPSNSPTPTLTRASTLTMSSLSSAFSSMMETPRASQAQEAYVAFPFTPTLTPRAPPLSASSAAKPETEYHVGPIISWPFFGSFRGDLPSVPEPASPMSYVPRGPFPTTAAYFAACVEREVLAVQRENAGSAAGHKLHLDPAEILSSRHHRVVGVEGDESDDSDEWGMEESEDEWEGPGDTMYRDYRRGHRGAFLVAHTLKRENSVRNELGRWMRRGGAKHDKDGEGEEEFALDAHDLSLENVFVDPKDPAVITCIIDWESTTTRPLWAAAHMPAFLQSSPFTAKLFREAVARLADPTADKTITGRRLSDGRPNGKELSKPKSNPNSKPIVPAPAPADAHVVRLAREWLHHECTGMRLRMAHRVIEWDGWEEGLVESILGPEEDEEEWFHHSDPEDEDGDSDHDAGEVCVDVEAADAPDDRANAAADGDSNGAGVLGKSLSRRRDSEPEESPAKGGKAAVPKPKAKGGAVTGKPAGGKLFAKNLEREKEQMLDITGDICGGRGGELGRRLEAWLTHSENNSVEDDDGLDDDQTHDLENRNGYDAEAEAD